MIEYVTAEELKCKCGCGLSSNKQFKDKLNIARDLAGVPFIMTSGARCEKHNRAVGGSPTSSHLKCIAGDIKFSNNRQKLKIVKGLLEAGFVRIGINEKAKFIHVDMDTSKPMSLFSY